MVISSVQKTLALIDIRKAHSDLAQLLRLAQRRHSAGRRFAQWASCVIPRAMNVLRSEARAGRCGRWLTPVVSTPASWSLCPAACLLNLADRRGRRSSMKSVLKTAFGEARRSGPKRCRESCPSTGCVMCELESAKRVPGSRREYQLLGDRPASVLFVRSVTNQRSAISAQCRMWAPRERPRRPRPQDARSVRPGPSGNRLSGGLCPAWMPVRTGGLDARASRQAMPSSRPGSPRATAPGTRSRSRARPTRPSPSRGPC